MPSPHLTSLPLHDGTPHAVPVIASLFLQTSCVAFTWGRSAGARHAMREASEAAMFLLSVAAVLTRARKNEPAPYSPVPFSSRFATRRSRLVRMHVAS
jgi:hypothetical protein